jgi:hypothetical protein
MPESRLQELLDREAIKELKARYFRLLDAKDWDAWRDVFTADVHVRILDGDPVDGVDAFVAKVRREVGDTRTAHHGHLPELTLESPTEARGVWSLNDYVEWPADPVTGERRGIKGYGRYDETYRKVDGAWKIASLRLTYIRIDPLYPQSLPDRILGGPALLDETTA